MNSDDVFGGAAYVFESNDEDESVEFVQKLTEETLADDDHFGFSVSISGDYIVVGAPLSNSTGEPNAGAAYIYKDSNVWKLLSPFPFNYAYFGWSVSVNINGVVAIGADEDRGSRGVVYIFKPIGSSTMWEHVFTLKPDVSKGANAGASVAIKDE